MAIALRGDGVGLRDVENGRRPGAPETAFALVGAVHAVGRHAIHVFLALFTLDGNEGHNLDAVLSAADLAAKRSPSVIGEDIFARLYLIFRDSLDRKPLDNGRPVSERLSANGAAKRFLLHGSALFFGSFHCLSLCWMN